MTAVSDDELRKAMKMAHHEAKKSARNRGILHLADEVESDLLVFIAEMALTFKDGERSFSSWVFEYLPGASKRSAGKLCRQYGLPPYDVEGIHPDELDEDNYEAAEFIRYAEEILEEDEYEVLVRTEAGESVEAIGECMSMSRATVYRRLESARGKLLAE